MIPSPRIFSDGSSFQYTVGSKFAWSFHYIFSRSVIDAIFNDDRDFFDIVWNLLREYDVIKHNPSAASCDKIDFAIRDINIRERILSMYG